MTSTATTSLVQWLSFDCELRLSVDALRKLRVALRRLRSDLQTFAPLFDRAWSAELRAARHLATRLGAVRDAEVLGDRLAGLLSLPPMASGPRAAAHRHGGAQLASARADCSTSSGGRRSCAARPRRRRVGGPRWGDRDGEPAWRAWPGGPGGGCAPRSRPTGPTGRRPAPSHPHPRQARALCRGREHPRRRGTGGSLRCNARGAAGRARRPPRCGGDPRVAAAAMPAVPPRSPSSAASWLRWS